MLTEKGKGADQSQASRFDTMAPAHWPPLLGNLSTPTRGFGSVTPLGFPKPTMASAVTQGVLETNNVKEQVTKTIDDSQEKCTREDSGLHFGIQREHKHKKKYVEPSPHAPKPSGILRDINYLFFDPPDQLDPTLIDDSSPSLKHNRQGKESSSVEDLTKILEEEPALEGTKARTVVKEDIQGRPSPQDLRLFDTLVLSSIRFLENASLDDANVIREAWNYIYLPAEIDQRITLPLDSFFLNMQRCRSSPWVYPPFQSELVAGKIAFKKKLSSLVAEKETVAATLNKKQKEIDSLKSTMKRDRLISDHMQNELHEKMEELKVLKGVHKKLQESPSVWKKLAR